MIDNGKWLSAEEYSGRPFDYMCPERGAAAHQPPGDEPKNYHMLVRHVFYMDEGMMERAGETVLDITADDYYKVWINGVFIGQGPAPGYPFRYYYSRYQIGSRLFPDAYIALHSAFEVHGYAPWAGNEVFVATGTRFTDFRYNGVFYRRVHPKVKASTEWVAGALVTSLEQTVVDSLYSFEGSEGLEDAVECIVRLPGLDADKLLECLERYGNGYLYQKCGYVLEQLQSYVKLPERFYRECREHCASTVRYMVKGAEGLVYHKGWGIYGPCIDNQLGKQN